MYGSVLAYSSPSRHTPSPPRRLSHDGASGNSIAASTSAIADSSSSQSNVAQAATASMMTSIPYTSSVSSSSQASLSASASLPSFTSDSRTNNISSSSSSSPSSSSTSSSSTAASSTSTNIELSRPTASPTPTPSLSTSSSLPTITPAMTARDRMAARLAASQTGAFAISRAAYDQAIAAGLSSSEAQKKADEAVAAHHVANGRVPPTPTRSVSSPDDEIPKATYDASSSNSLLMPPRRPPELRTARSEEAIMQYPAAASSSSSSSSSIQQPPNAVSAALHQQTRNRASSTTPASASLSEADWAIKDAQFMAGLCYGCAAAQGERANMEDEHRIVPQFDRLIRLCNPVTPRTAAASSSSSSSSSADSSNVSPTSPASNHPHRGQQAFFGIYDGHGGREAAEFVRDHLHINIAKRMTYENGVQRRDLGEAMKLGAADTEKELLLHSLSQQSIAGAVVAFTVFSGMQVYVCHAGDSRAVLCRDGVAMDLTQDHKPGLESEQGRVAALGGFISDGCVNGEIGVSRALGDVNLETGAKMLGLSADVALSKFYLTDEDEFVIIACDGLYDVMSSAAAVSYARHQLAQHNDIQRCASELVQQALRQHSSDNVSCIIVQFSTSKHYAESEQQSLIGSVGSSSRRLRVPIPPRPQRLQLNRGGLSNLLAALDLSEEDVKKQKMSKATEQGDDEEDGDTEGEDDEAEEDGN